MLLVTTLISSIGSLILGAYTLKANPKERKNQFFAIFCFTLISWLILNYLSFVVENIYVVRVLMASAALFSVHLFLFAYCFAYEKPSKRIILLSYLVLVVAIVVALSPFLFEDVVYDSESPYPVIGIGMIFFVPFSLIVILLPAYIFLQTSRSNKVLKSIQSRIMLVGLVLMVSIIVFFNFIVVNLWYTTRFIPIGVLSTLIFVGASTFALTRYRFLNIKIEIKQAVAYWSAVIITLVLIASAAAALSQAVGLTVSLFITALILFLYIKFLDRRFRFFLDGLFFLNRIDPSRTFRLEGDKIDPEQRLRLWAEELGEKLEQEGIELIHAYALQRQHNRMFDYAGQHGEKYIWLKDPLVKHLNSAPQQLFFSLDSVSAKCKQSADQVVQLRFKGQLMGVLFLRATAYNQISVAALLKDYAYLCYGTVQWYEAAIGIKRTAKEMVYQQNQ